MNQDEREAVWRNPAPNAAAAGITTGHHSIVSSAAKADSRDVIEAWTFNVRLECSAHDEALGPLECLIGGAILNLHDLDRILTAKGRAMQ